MKPTDALDKNQRLVSAMMYYFLQDDGSRFKATLIYQPYFLIQTKPNFENEVQSFLEKKYSNYISKIEIIEKEDLDLDNHLSGLKKKLLKLSFYQIDDLVRVRKEIMPKAERNRKELQQNSGRYSKLLSEHLAKDLPERIGNNVNTNSKLTSNNQWMENIIDIREHDVPYQIRVSIDPEIFVSRWYDVSAPGGIWSTQLEERKDLVDQPDPVVLAYDIETTKLPLKFPDSRFDQIMMISYMIDRSGFLIINREIISEDIDDFEFTPRPEYPGPFTVFNETNEKRTIERFFEHIRETKPDIFVTYNGDQFDWPFVETRARFHELDMWDSIGIRKDSQDDYSSSSSPLNLDCFRWVQRDSYLPIGAQGLKAVCKAKLRYDPVEVEPEEMCRLAREEPRALANYSVSDAVATYYLFDKFVRPFIFALCTIVPLPPDAVLRKGSGTLCECLLMARAFHSRIVFPNKQQTDFDSHPTTSDGHLIESETYVGGHVEAIESGVFRSDIPTKFRIVADTVRILRQNLQAALENTLAVDEKIDSIEDQIENFESVFQEIDEKLVELETRPNRFECPVIYHLDVAAMYPNIILSNRLQPSALVTDKICSSCDFNTGPDALCKRSMNWKWRAEVSPATRSELSLIQNQLEREKFPSKQPGRPMRSFHELDNQERISIEKDRLAKFCRNAYKRRHDVRTEERAATVCQKENSFYVDTVRDFRDRRYEFKDLTKKWKNQLDKLEKSKGDPSEIKRANGLLVLYDSLQLAHKCILNSFYGYVMRRGARWYSMEMAGIVCHTGAAIIKSAREIIEQIGRPLELDTDGIWCILPASFPENFTFRCRQTGNRPVRSSITVNYPALLLNSMIRDQFTNHQYHHLIDETNFTYEIRSENSVYFEVDGPYRAMILPAAKEQGKKLKKRYAVFNLDGSLAELKGFEVKRNGELNLIKIFQSSVFEAFLKGISLEDLYQHVAGVADYWLDWLYSRAANVPDDELFELISEKRVMSKRLEEYGAQKSTSISTARRLAEFLGDEMVKDAGLSFKFVISRKPDGLQVTDRAIPVAIFQAEPAVKRFYLSKWLRLSSKDSPELDDIRDIIDWDYYINRFSSNVQKIITIPAALQHVPNPVPRVAHPDWLHKKLLEKNDPFKQKRIDEMFKPVDIEQIAEKRIIVPSKRKEPEPEIGNKPTVIKTINIKWPKTVEEFDEWFAFHKARWDCQMDQSAVQVKRRKTHHGMSSFLDQAKKSILDGNWEIIQILETMTPGEYRLWVLIGRDLHQVRVNVPRTFYVNSRFEKPESNDKDKFYYRRVHKVLPRSRPVHFLYEYSIDELTFQQFQADIMSEFTGNDSEGVYEMRVPLMFRLLTKLGCLCCVDKSIKKSIKTGFETRVFELTQLKSVTVSHHHSYLPSDRSAFRTAFLFQKKTGYNQLFGLFIPAQNRTYLHVVGKSASQKHLVELTQSMYQKELEKRRERDGVLLPSSEISFDVLIDLSESQAIRSIGKLLQTMRTEVKVPTVIVNQTSATLDWMYTNISTLNEFPLVTLVTPATDSSSLPSLDWERLMIRDSIRAFLDFPVLFERLLERSRYFHIPVGNLNSFNLNDSCDVLFARRLVSQDHLLWCSRLSEPDLGGREMVDRRLLIVGTDASSGAIQCNRPSCYPSVCVDLEVSFLPVDTVVALQRVLELDSQSGRTFDSIQPQMRPIDEALSGGFDGPARYEDSSAAASAFRVMRQMLLGWLQDVRLAHNPIADELIVGFYKWLRYPQSLLYDPALYKTLQQSMRRVFYKLVERFGEFGFDVVFGSANRIVLATHRTDFVDALTHVEHATKCLREHELFAHIDFQYVRGWHFLLWLDPFNFSGVKTDIDQSIPNSSNSGIFTQQSTTVVDNHWHLAKYFADVSIVQTRFTEFLQDYVSESWAIIRHQFRTEQLGADASLYPTSLQRMDEFLRSDLCHKLYGLVVKLRDIPKFNRYPQNTIRIDRNIAPVLPVMKRKDDQTPLVDFVNIISYTLSLDPTTQSYIDDWKRNMLRLISVDEFSDLSKWRSPYSSSNVVTSRNAVCRGELLVVVPEVICSNCGNCRDLDVCRDLYCSFFKEGWWFVCPKCQVPHSRSIIENILVEQINGLFEAALLQDVQCNKCFRGILETSLAGTKNCLTCGNAIIVTHSAQLLEQQIRVYADISEYFQLTYLRCVTDWLLNCAVL